MVMEGVGWKLQMDNELPSELEVGRVYNIQKGKYHRLGRHKLKTNNTLILNFDKYGILKSKDFYNKDNINQIKFSKKTTENNLSKKSFVETFLQSVKKKMYGSR